MGALGSGIASGINSVNQLQQQQNHNAFMSNLMQQMMGQGGSPTAPVMTGPMQGPALPEGGVSLQNKMMGKVRRTPLYGIVNGGQ